MIGNIQILHVVTRIILILKFQKKKKKKKKTKKEKKCEKGIIIYLIRYSSIFKKKKVIKFQKDLKFLL
jgi:hypothetical protein